MSFNSNSMLMATKTSLVKNSPKFCTYGGLALLIGGGAYAAYKSKDFNNILDKHKKDISELKENASELEESVNKKEIAKVYLNTIGSFSKMYAVPVLMTLGGASLVLTGNNILNKRNVALASAYATVDGAFKKYRSNVLDRFGEEVETELMTGGHKETIEETDDNTGEITKKDVMVINEELNGYSRFFAYGFAEAAEPNATYNKYFLDGQEHAANFELVRKGYLFLNEVYEMLGFKGTKAGQSVGWIYENGDGDGHVSFRIKETYRVNEEGNYIRGYLLDFNIDGAIVDKAIKLGLIDK